jgi:hypothetical protein
VWDVMNLLVNARPGTVPAWFMSIWSREHGLDVNSIPLFGSVWIVSYFALLPAMPVH